MVIQKSMHKTRRRKPQQDAPKQNRIMKSYYRLQRIVLLTMLLSAVGLERLSAQTCEANFTFAFANEELAILYPAPGPYENIIWIINGVSQPGQPGAAYWLTTASDTTYVCLVVIDSTGCNDVICRDVYANSPEALCATTDCVWPGDATGDRKANLYDLLNIGLGYGAQGPVRTIFPSPDNPIVWAPNFSEDWGSQPNLPDFKHLDCDGNGVVDLADVEAIHYNYFPDLAYTSQPVSGAPPVFLVLSMDTIYVEELMNVASLEITAELWAGTPDQPFANFYGLALGVRYPEGINYVNTAYQENAFMGAPEEVLSLQRNLAPTWNHNRIDLAFARTSGEGVIGGGPIATASFIISSDIIGGREEPTYDIYFGLEGIRLVDENGDTLSYHLPGASGVVTVINEVIANDRSAPEHERGWRVFPNPAHNELNVRFSAAASGQLNLYNGLGQLVQTRRLLAESGVSAPVAGLPAGLYTLEWVAEDGKSQQQRVMVGGR
jgi:hypothetical protein